MMLWMITDVSEWMSIREITEKWRLDIVRNIPNSYTWWPVRNAVQSFVVTVWNSLILALMVCRRTLSKGFSPPFLFKTVSQFDLDQKPSLQGRCDWTTHYICTKVSALPSSLYCWSSQRANLIANLNSACCKTPLCKFLEQLGQPVAFESIL